MVDHQSKARAYHEAIKQALLTEWDPIGVAAIAEAQDEYDGYVPALYKMLIEHQPSAKIFAYLWWLETEHMGLLGDRQVTEKFAERLVELSIQIDQESGKLRGVGAS